MIAEEPTQKQKCYTYEEAIGAVSVGKFHYFLLITCGLCYVAVSSEIVGLSIVSYSAQCELDFTLFEKGFLNSVGYLGVVISSHMMGFLADTLGRVQLLKMSLIVSICTSTISVFSNSTSMLIAFRFFTGIFMCGCQSCIFTLLSEYHSDKSRMKHITILASFMVFGLLYTQGMAIAILPLDLTNIPYITPWRLLLLLFLLPSVLALICLAFTPESPKYLLSKGEQIQSINILSKVYAINKGIPATSYPCEFVVIGDYDEACQDQGANKLKQMWTQTLMLFNKERITKTSILCFLAFFPTLIGSGSFMWLPLILHNLITYSDRAYTICDAVVESSSNSTNVDICSKVVETSQYNILIFMSVVYFVLFVINSLVINTVGKKALLVFWYAVGMAFALSAYWSNFYLLNIIALTFIIQVANWIGIVTGIASEYYPTSINAMGVCFVMMISRIGAVVGSNIVGPLLITYCDYMFFMYGGLMLIIVIFTFILPTKSKSK